MEEFVSKKSVSIDRLTCPLFLVITWKRLNWPDKLWYHQNETWQTYFHYYTHRPSSSSSSHQVNNETASSFLLWPAVSVVFVATVKSPLSVSFRTCCHFRQLQECHKFIRPERNITANEFLNRIIEQHQRELWRLFIWTISVKGNIWSENVYK